jgi:putative IMPACT (imprinted ancient) family translation regulator
MVMSYLPLKKGKGYASLLASSFEAEAMGISSIEQFDELYSSFKLAHPKADHYPYAFRIRGYEKSSDDGEPGSSAGKPILMMLEERDIDCALVIVARYFGGTKLGVGRLKRCFVEAAKASLDEASYGCEHPFRLYHLSLSYSRYQEIKRLAKKSGFILKDEQFALEVKANLYVDGKIPFDAASLLIKEEEVVGEEEVTLLLEGKND